MEKSLRDKLIAYFKRNTFTSFFKICQSINKSEMT